ncbi:MAG: A24 family peptidase [Burkholderiales bacterium]|jgi:leader peptidase (prepilin peptidase)/N-methyltransferase
MPSLGSLAHPAVFPWLCLALGLCIGSFLNVVIYRLPKIMQRDWEHQCAELRGEKPPEHEPFNLALPRSHCPACAQPITALQNIPLASYLALGGKCAACGARISPRYALIEALGGLAGAYAAWRFGFGLAAFAAMLFLWCMIALSFIDFDTQLLPDSITLPLLWAGLLLNLSGTFVDLGSAVIGAAAGYLSLWCVYWGFRFATGKEGMGFGDFKLLAAIGAWLGWQMLPLVVLASSFVGAIAGISLMLFARHGRNVPIPFGPYLAVAGAVALFWGKSLTFAYLGLF